MKRWTVDFTFAIMKLFIFFISVIGITIAVSLRQLKFTGHIRFHIGRYKRIHMRAVFLC